VKWLKYKKKAASPVIFEFKSRRSAVTRFNRIRHPRPSNLNALIWRFTVSKKNIGFRRLAAPLQVCLLAALFLAAGALQAQLAGTGTIQGTVTDTSGALVPDANVTLTDTASGVVRTAKADSGGTFLFPNVEISTYSLKVTAGGFERYVQTNIVL